MSRSASFPVLLMLALAAGAYGQTSASSRVLAKGGVPDAPSAISLASANLPAEPGEGVAFSAMVASNPQKPAPRPARIVDRRFATWFIAANAATVLDVESTIHALNTNPAVYETQSWFYGRHPNRARMYGTALPLNFAAGYVAYFAKKRFCPSSHCWLWQLPMTGLTIAHAGAGTWNYATF